MSNLKLDIPFNQNHEESVLSLLLRDISEHHHLLLSLRPDDFFLSHHQDLFSSIRHLHQLKLPTDIISILEYCQRNNINPLIDAAFLGRLIDLIQTSSSHSYIKSLRDLKQKRQILNLAQKLNHQARDLDQSSEDLLQDIEKQLTQIHLLKDNEFKNWKSLSETTNLHLQTSLNSGHLIGIPSGVSGLDQLTRGFCPGQLIIVGGRPSSGKTALALNFINTASTYFNLTNPDSNYSKSNVFFLSLEMNASEIGSRLLSLRESRDIKKAYFGFTSNQIKDAVFSKFNNLNLYFDDQTDGDFYSLLRSIRKVSRSKRIKLVVIDYLQLLSIKGYNSREREIASISRQLKLLAKELDICIITLSQLNRDIESREIRKPRPSDLRESGAIEQDADLILLLEKKNESEVVLHVSKNRSGLTGEIDMVFNGENMSFYQSKTN